MFLDSLPATAYVKMIDIWLIFAISIPFCEVNIKHFSNEIIIRVFWE